MNKADSNHHEKFLGPIVNVRRSELIYIRLVQTLCFLGLVVANIYGWSMIHAGFVNTRFLPENSFFGSSLVSLWISFFVQLGILLFYLSFPYLREYSRWWTKIVVIPLWLLLIVLAWTFCLYSITISSNKDNIINYYREQVVGINRDLQRVDSEITKTYTAYVAGLDQSRIDACAGRDETGIAICGSISTRYLKQTVYFRNNHGPLLKDRLVPDLPPTSASDAARIVVSNADVLSNKVTAFARFGRESGLITAPVLESFRAAQTSAREVQRTFADQSPDARALVLGRTMENIFKIISGTADAEIYMAAVIAALPDLLSLLFSYYLGIYRNVLGGGANLSKAIQDTERQTRFYERWYSALMRQYNEKMRVWGAQVRNDSADVITQPREPTHPAGRGDEHG